MFLCKVKNINLRINLMRRIILFYSLFNILFFFVSLRFLFITYSLFFVISSYLPFYFILCMKLHVWCSQAFIFLLVFYKLSLLLMLVLAVYSALYETILNEWVSELCVVDKYCFTIIIIVAESVSRVLIYIVPLHQYVFVEIKYKLYEWVF